MTLKHEKRNITLAGLVIGVIASLLVLFGNPKNMGISVRRSSVRCSEAS